MFSLQQFYIKLQVNLQRTDMQQCVHNATVCIGRIIILQYIKICRMSCNRFIAQGIVSAVIKADTIAVPAVCVLYRKTAQKSQSSKTAKIKMFINYKHKTYALA